MTTTSSNLRCLLCLAVALVVAGCAATAVRTHPEFAGLKRPLKTVALLPADAEIVTLAFSGENQRVRWLEDNAQRELALRAKAALGGAGYEVSEEALQLIARGDKDTSFEFEQFKDAYTHCAQEFAKTSNAANGFKCSTGASAGALAASAHADGLLFVRYRGFGKTRGMIAKDIAASILFGALTGFVINRAKEGNAVEVALIDALSGEVLWVNAAKGQTEEGWDSLRVAMQPLPKRPATQVVEDAGAGPRTSDQP